MEYRREVGIPFRAAEFQVTVTIGETSYKQLLHVSRSGNGALHPIEIVYLPGGIADSLQLKPHQSGDCSWDVGRNPAYVKRITFQEYDESEMPEERAKDFSKAIYEFTDGRITIQ